MCVLRWPSLEWLCCLQPEPPAWMCCTLLQKVRMEIVNLAKSGHPAKSGAAGAASELLRGMMQSLACCRVQR